MKSKVFTELKGKEIKDLEKMVAEKKAEVIKKRMETVAGKEKNLKVAKNLRLEIAKILTLIREKEIVGKLEAESEEGKTK